MSEGKRRRRKVVRTTADQVRDIRYRRARGEKLIVLALEHKLSVSTISRICRGLLWAEVEA